MNVTSVRERSISITVPAPPPPSPRHDESEGTTLVMAVDLEELLRLLCCKTNTVLPVSAASVPASTSPPSISRTSASPSPTRSPLETVGAEVLTTEGNGGDGSSGQAGPVPGPSFGLGSDPSRSLDGIADAGDESLQRYKLSLGLGGGKDLSDPNDPRVCIIQALTMESPGRNPETIDLSVSGSEVTLKDHPFKIKEGARFTMGATFKVQHEVLSGLRYVQIVKRKGIRVSKDSEMIGSYAPNTDKQPVYTKRFQEDEAPSGMLARGHYQAISSFVDDDKKTHLEFEWSFDISKDW